jgi:hypothetical protein
MIKEEIELHELLLINPIFSLFVYLAFLYFNMVTFTLEHKLDVLLFPLRILAHRQLVKEEI